MKRKVKQSAPTPPVTLDDKLRLIESVMKRYLHPRLLKHRLGDTEPLVSWEFTMVYTGLTDKQHQLDIRANHETPATMCRGEMRTTTHGWAFLTDINETSVTNALFHALSGLGSSYTFNGKRWDRLSYIYG